MKSITETINESNSYGLNPETSKKFSANKANRKGGTMTFDVKPLSDKYKNLPMLVGVDFNNVLGVLYGGPFKLNNITRAKQIESELKKLGYKIESSAEDILDEIEDNELDPETLMSYFIPCTETNEMIKTAVCYTYDSVGIYPIASKY